MKLIYCSKCSDIVKLFKYKRWCNCGKSWGYYGTDGINAVYGGESIPLAIDNFSFGRAIHEFPFVSNVSPTKGEEFRAIVCPINAEKFKKET